jgi:Ca2+-transporting ATPase
VSKEAAVMIRTDDNFATIIRAIEIGRKLYDNLMKYIRLQMASLFGFIVLFLVAALFNILQGAPISALGVLWENFTVIVFMAIGLGTGEASPPVPTTEGQWPASSTGVLRTASLGTKWRRLAVTAQFALIAGGEHVAQTIALTTFSLACIFWARLQRELTSAFSRDRCTTTTHQRTGWSLLATSLSSRWTS